MSMNDLKRSGLTSTVVKLISEIDTSVRKMLATGILSKPLYPTLFEDTPAQLTADANNYDPGNHGSLRMSSNASRTITGIDGGVTARLLTILNVGSNNIVIAHQSASSSVENRIITATAANVTLGANDSITLYYDATDERWRVTALVQ